MFLQHSIQKRSIVRRTVRTMFGELIVRPIKNRLWSFQCWNRLQMRVQSGTPTLLANVKEIDKVLRKRARWVLNDQRQNAGSPELANNAIQKTKIQTGYLLQLPPWTHRHQHYQVPANFLQDQNKHQTNPQPQLRSILHDLIPPDVVSPLNHCRLE